jgi:uncharacterized RDD family membrane protein YckC
VTESAGPPAVPTGAAAPPIGWEPPPEAIEGPAPGIKYAPHGVRLLAYLIDTVVLIAMIVAWVFLTAAAGALTSDAVGVGIGLVSILGLLLAMHAYFAYSWSHGGQTLGMKPFRLYVVRDRDGGPVGRGKAWLRAFGLFFIDGAVLYIGFIWVFIDARRRAWHDIMAETVVIQK